MNRQRRSEIKKVTKELDVVLKTIKELESSENINKFSAEKLTKMKEQLLEL